MALSKASAIALVMAAVFAALAVVGSAQDVPAPAPAPAAGAGSLVLPVGAAGVALVVSLLLGSALRI
ncbi:hypothetical protein Ddye_007860 [Dipteronia dyeriana]|uniref:Uncharacterized protein n=1 Tax=Dipteronia dyeriana TaxID=168575 RepID=A0AAD9XL16_9ROSI|nr:hypothetical protein Ddye_007860 [Dipteronia dyeriana]